MRRVWNSKRGGLLAAMLVLAGCAGSMTSPDPLVELRRQCVNAVPSINNPQNERIEVCYINPAAGMAVGKESLSPGRRYAGVWNYGKRRWQVAPVYQDAEVLGPQAIYGRRYGEAGYQLLTGAQGHEPFFHAFLRPRRSTDGLTNGVLGFVDPENNTAIVLKAGKPAGRIDHVDKPLVVSDDVVIEPAYAGAEGGGMVVRHRQGGKAYYQAYTSSGEPIGPRYPADEVRLGLSKYLTRDYFLLIHDRGKGLLWPIMVGDDRTVELSKIMLGFDGYSFDPVEGSPLPRVKFWFLRMDDKQPWRWREMGLWQAPDIDGFYNKMRLVGQGHAYEYIGGVSRWDIVESPTIPLGGRAVVAQNKNAVFVSDAEGAHIPGLTVFNTFEEAYVAIANANQLYEAEMERRKAAAAAQQKRKYEQEAAERRARQQAQFASIDRVGPNPASLSTYGYETEYYCAMGGRRCEEFRRQYRQMEKDHNQSVANANRARLEKVYRQSLDLDKVKASTECFRRAAESKSRAVSGRQDWYFSSKGCK